MKPAKVFLFVFGFLVLSFIGIAVFQRMHFRNSVAKMEVIFQEDQRELERIRNLPEVVGVIEADSSINAIFSNEEVAGYSLRCGVRTRNSTSKKGRLRSNSPAYTNSYAYEQIIVAAPGTMLKVDGKNYAFQFEEFLPLLSSSKTPENAKKGYQGRHFSSRQNSTLADLLLTDPKRDSAFKAEMILLETLKGKNKMLDRYFQLRDNSGIGALVSETLYLPGDTIKFKGKIEDGNLIPLY